MEALSVVVFFMTIFMVSGMPSHLIFMENFRSGLEEDRFLARLAGLQKNAVDLRLHHGSELVQLALFHEFTELFQRSYSGEEQQRRFLIFQKNLHIQQSLREANRNVDGHTSYGINKFADWTASEFQEFLGGKKSHASSHQRQMLAHVADASRVPKVRCAVTTRTPPPAVDWQIKGVVTPVRLQGNCAGCWAYVAAEQVESYWAIAGHNLTDLSVQEFVSCAPHGGCQGGSVCDALSWLANGTYEGQKLFLLPASEYPLEDRDTPCKYGELVHTGAQISDVCLCQSMVGQEDVLLNVLEQKGPIAVDVDATTWQFYVGGVISQNCPTDVNHSVQLVAYDLSGPEKYWRAKNSWGTSYGEKGYVRVKYGENMCGLATNPSFVEV